MSMEGKSGHTNAETSASLPNLPPHLLRKMTSEEINALPIKSFSGSIHVIDSCDHIPSVVSRLNGEVLLGFDTEKRPSFKKGVVHKPALLQLAASDAVYIFRIHKTGFHDCLVDLLADVKVAKVGVAIDRDVIELTQLKEFAPDGFVDLGECAKASGIQHHGLRGLAALLLDFRISKGAQLTNWERPDMPVAAVTYAATDAWVARKIHEEMQRLGIQMKPAPPRLPKQKEFSFNQTSQHRRPRHSPGSHRAGGKGHDRHSEG